ncbi:hypothetical protein GCM10027059_40510 [Myceligenerans halotolerans]
MMLRFVANRNGLPPRTSGAGHWRRDGKVLAIEVKLADRAEDADVKHLRWLSDQIGDNLIDAVVVTAGEHAYRRRDGIAVVPAALLGS